MNAVPHEIGKLVLAVRERLPQERRDAFCRAALKRLKQVAYSDTFLASLTGATIGFFIEECTPVGWLWFCDDLIEKGAVAGALVGGLSDLRSVRRQREEVRNSIREALAETVG